MFPFTIIQKIKDYFAHQRFIKNAMEPLNRPYHKRWK